MGVGKSPDGRPVCADIVFVRVGWEMAVFDGLLLPPDCPEVVGVGPVGTPSEFPLPVWEPLGCTIPEFSLLL